MKRTGAPVSRFELHSWYSFGLYGVNFPSCNGVYRWVLRVLDKNPYSADCTQNLCRHAIALYRCELLVCMPPKPHRMTSNAFCEAFLGHLRESFCEASRGVFHAAFQFVFKSSPSQRYQFVQLISPQIERTSTFFLVFFKCFTFWVWRIGRSSLNVFGVNLFG